MKRFITGALLIISCNLWTANADQFDDAMFQFNRGEYQAATKMLTPLAEDGFSPAQYQLSEIYIKGLGTEKDIELGLQYLKKAADKNYPDALFDLAVMYGEGKYVGLDLSKSFELMKKAANTGMASAQFNVGVMYYNGTGVKKDNLQAFRWYERAAKLNYALAQFNLALMYYNGEGVEKSTEMSYIWNSIAAMNGYPNAAKSRDMDAHKMSATDVNIANDKIKSMYDRILAQAKVRERIANKVKFY